MLLDLDSTTGSHAQTAPVLDGFGDLFGLTTEGNNGEDPNGTVFEIPAGEHQATALTSFGLSNMMPPPNSGLAIDHLDNLFNLFQGGSVQYPQGAIIEINSNGLSTVVNFNTATAAGGRPIGALTLFQTPATFASEPTDELFGINSSGGPNDTGTIYEYTSSGGLQVLVSLPASGFDSSTGASYGVTNAGGTDNDGVVFKYASGVISDIASFDGDNGQNPSSGLAEDAQGDLFGTTYGGGANSLGTIYEIPAGTSTIKTLVSFDGTNLGALPTSGLTFDRNGNLFGISSVGGSNGDGVVYELSPQPTQLQFVLQPISASTGQSLSFVTANVEDASGNTVFADNSTVTLALNASNSATLSGTLTAQATDGIASFSDLSISTPTPTPSQPPTVPSPRRHPLRSP